MTTNKEALEAFEYILSCNKTIEQFRDEEVNTVRQALERPQVDVEEVRDDMKSYLNNKIKDCPFKVANLIKNDIINISASYLDRLNGQGYLSQPDTCKDGVIEVDLDDFFENMANKSSYEIVGRIMDLNKKYAGKAIRIKGDCGE